MNDLETFVILMHALAGVAGALSVIVFAWGFVVYLTRLGTERRLEGIHIMEWGVALMFSALVVIGVLRLGQHLFG